MTARATAVLVVSLLLAGCGADGVPRERPPPEGPYDVAVAGAHQEYEGTRAGANAVLRTWIVGTSSGGFTRQAVTSFPATAGGERVWSTHAVAADGSEYLVKTERWSATGSDVVTTRTYAPPILVLPADDTPGYAERNVATVTVENTGSWPLTCEVTRELTVIGSETVVVPAGTFRALKIAAHDTMVCGTPGSSPTESDGVAWWAPGVGAVKLASHPSGSRDLGETYQLTGYGIAPLPPAATRWLSPESPPGAEVSPEPVD